MTEPKDEMMRDLESIRRAAKRGDTWAIPFIVDAVELMIDECHIRRQAPTLTQWLIERRLVEWWLDHPRALRIARWLLGI